MTIDKATIEGILEAEEKVLSEMVLKGFVRDEIPTDELAKMIKKELDEGG